MAKPKRVKAFKKHTKPVKGLVRKAGKSHPKLTTPINDGGCDCCAGSTGPADQLMICKDIGGGARSFTPVPNPTGSARKVLCFESGSIFWGTAP